MAISVDPAINYLPQRVQREFDETLARGMRSPLVDAILPLNDVLKSRAATISGQAATIRRLETELNCLWAGLSAP